MSNLFDFPRFSTYVEGVMERKLKTLSDSISTATGYFNRMVQKSEDQATISTTQAGISKDSADKSLVLWNNFLSTFLGVTDSAPTQSANGKPINEGAFYVRKTNQRLRVATAVVNGVPTWQDAQVRADYDTVVEAGKDVFLFLNKPERQIVSGDVSYTKIPLVPDTTDWTSTQATNAKSVTAKLQELATNLATTVSTAVTTLNNNYNTFTGKFASGSNENGYWETSPKMQTMGGSVFALGGTRTQVSVVLPIAALNANYVVIATPIVLNPVSNNDNNRKDIWVHVIRTTRTTNGFTVQYNADDAEIESLPGFDWMIKVYDNGDGQGIPVTNR